MSNSTPEETPAAPIPTIGEFAAARRGLGLMFRAAPVATISLVTLDVAQGLVPAVVVTATARLVGELGANRGGTLATPGVLTAIAALTGALALSRSLGPAVKAIELAVTQKFGAALTEARLRSVLALPGLHHLEDPRTADLLGAAGRATAPFQLVMSIGRSIRIPSTIASAAWIVGSQLAWAPLLPIAIAAGIAYNGWRHSGEQRAAALVEMSSFRVAQYAEWLGNSPDAARESRLLRLGGWAMERHGTYTDRWMAPLFVDYKKQLFESLALTAARVVAVVLPLTVAFMQLRDGRLELEGFTALALGLGALGAALTEAEYIPGSLRANVQFLPEAFGVIDLPATDPRMEAAGDRFPASTPRTGIVFEDVSFSYPNTDRPVLDGFSLSIPAGTSLALVGENGAGKSTLVKLLCRFYDPDRGRITLDGIDLRDYDLADLRARFAPVFQDFSRFPMTFRENVGVGCVERIEDKEFVASVATGTGAAELAATLPEGRETVLSKEFGGVELSEGQWQRVALARAIAARDGRGSSILVLDEPTAAMDVRLEHELFERFGQLSRGLTTLLISHRFSTVRMADCIAVVEDGAVIEQGSHDELVRAGARYAELFEMQSRRFREQGELE